MENKTCNNYERKQNKNAVYFINKQKKLVNINKHSQSKMNKFEHILLLLRATPRQNKENKPQI